MLPQAMSIKGDTVDKESIHHLLVLHHALQPFPSPANSLSSAAIYHLRKDARSDKHYILRVDSLVYCEVTVYYKCVLP